jgi:hypothetical protein
MISEAIAAHAIGRSAHKDENNCKRVFIQDTKIVLTSFFHLGFLCVLATSFVAPCLRGSKSFPNPQKMEQNDARIVHPGRHPCGMLE